MKVIVVLALALLMVGCDRKEAEQKAREEKYESAIGDTHKLLESRLDDWKAGKIANDVLPMAESDKALDLNHKLRTATLIGYQIPPYRNTNTKANTLWRTELKFRGADGKEFNQMMNYHIIGDSVEASAP